MEITLCIIGIATIPAGKSLTNPVIAIKEGEIKWKLKTNIIRSMDFKKPTASVHHSFVNQIIIYLGHISSAMILTELSYAELVFADYDSNGNSTTKLVFARAIKEVI